MLYRKIERLIRNWVISGKEPLLINGARKVGKTYTVRKILKEMGCDYAEFNLLENPTLINLLTKSETGDEVITNLSLFTKKKLIKGKTIIYFDEIQEYSELAPKIDLIVKEGSFRYLFSGCFYGEALQSLRLVSPEDLRIIKMYPMDFEEFLQIYQFGEKQKNILYRCYLEEKPVPESVHLRMMHLFRTYLYVGGMPSVVEAFAKLRDLDVCMKEQKKLLTLYRSSLAEGTRGLKRNYLTEIFRLIPLELNQHNKRFHFSDITKGLRFDRNGKSFHHICQMGIALPVYQISGLDIPLVLSEKRTLFKLFLCDVGLLTASYGTTVKDALLTEEADTCNGAIYENAVAQNLLSFGYDLHYFSSKRYGELDYVIERRGRALPIQIKAGKTYHRHSAVVNIEAVSEGKIKDILIFTEKNVKRGKDVIQYPIYMIMFLAKEYNHIKTGTES